MKKKNLKIFICLILLFSTLLMLASCSVNELASIIGADRSDETADNKEASSDGTEYMTKEDVEALIAGIRQNVSVTNQDIDISSSYSKNLLAAAKGLLSAVSISATFDVSYTYGGGLFGTPTTQTKKETSGGAGVIYQLDKNTGSAYIITNYHVVYNVNSDPTDHISDDIKVYLYGMEYDKYAINAAYIGGSMKYDIAVLKVTGSDVLRGSDARAASFANSDTVSVLDTVIAIGNPAGGGISATVGCVNVDSEYITMEAVDGVSQMEMRVMRIDAAVNGGNSGGGLFNDEGNVIGIVNAKITSSTIDNIGYAIPSNVAKYVADNIIYYDKQSSANDSAKRVTIGITMKVNEAWSSYDTETGKVHKYEQVAISSVNSGSSAALAGLAEGDIINSVTIDGVVYQVNRYYTVYDVMLTARAESTVAFEITRGSQSLNITVDLSGAELTAV